MNIVIFDDDPAFRKKLINTLRPLICFDDSITLSTGSVNEIKKYIRDNDALTLYFLDLVVKEKAVGLELCEQIEQHNKTDSVIFITDYPDKIYYSPLHKISAFSIIIKDSPFFEQEIALTLSKVQMLKDDKNSLVINSRYGDIFKVFFCDIYFIETVKGKHKIRILYKNGSYECRHTLNDVINLLDGRFIRCHDSYIVNIDKINFIHKPTKKIIFENNLFCYYSVKYKKALVERLI